MNLKLYYAEKSRRALLETASGPRAICPRCRKAALACYCSKIRPFSPKTIFVILIHPRENKKRIGTGRLTHLCLANSILIEGLDFSKDKVLASILGDPQYWTVVLYPGPRAVDITTPESLKRLQVPDGKKLAVLVIDATWSSAKKMLRLNPFLQSLPQICFTPPHPSAYRIRKQPRENYFSTVEAVHFMLGRLGSEDGRHDNLLEVFQAMVAQQLSYQRILRTLPIS